MAHHEFDLLIAGAGPAGCTLALNLAPKGIRIGILEKDIFPRQKICGDALSGKVFSVMKRIPGGVYEEFLSTVEKTPSYGIRFTAPGGGSADIPFLQAPDKQQPAPGFVCNRLAFDSFMAGALKKYANVELLQGERIERAILRPSSVVVATPENEYTAKVIAGADGVHSAIRKSFQGEPDVKSHLCLGIRGYYENVTGLHPDNHIELIFLKRLLPGYFWIFPTAGGLVNAGFGMMHSAIRKSRKNMVHILHDIITNDPLIAPRFRNATLTGKPEAHQLPLGTRRTCYSGERHLLLGDAAFLVDPFSGEGIGNAMASGEIAAQVLEKCFAAGNFSADALAAYDARIRQRFAQEFRVMRGMQRLAGSAALVNLVINKAAKNNELRELLTRMFTSMDVRKNLTSPRFYAGLLFK